MDATPNPRSPANLPLSISLEPKTKLDHERLERGLQQLLAEDPALRATTDTQMGRTTIRGLGELQLEIVLDRLRRDFNVEAWVGRPQVAYKETLTRAADGETKYARQSGGSGQYAHARIRVHPGEPGTGYAFVNEIVGGAIPREFIRSIDEGIREALALRALAGYPIDDVRVELCDGSYHDADSSEQAFRIAGSMAFQDAARKAEPILLEPVMRVEVVMAKVYVIDVVGDLSSRRGRIESGEARGDMYIVTALVPLSEMFGYASDLRSRTLGQATYSMRFECYEPCRPPDTDEGRDDSVVGAPRKPTTPLRSSRIALPEPDAGSSEGPDH